MYFHTHMHARQGCRAYGFMRVRVSARLRVRLRVRVRIRVRGWN